MTQPSSVTLHAVIEIPPGDEVPWITPQPALDAVARPLEAPPFPFVRLHRGTSPDDVARVMCVLSSYGRKSHEPASTAAALLKDFPIIVPGGLAIVGSERVIWPGCCCGLEKWREARCSASRSESRGWLVTQDLAVSEKLVRRFARNFVRRTNTVR